MRQIRRGAFALVAACALAGGGGGARVAGAAPSQAPRTVVYLVRHAEPTPPPYDGSPPDPHLSDAGRARAGSLADVLGDEPLERILSTDLNRTRETAAPVSARTGVSVEIYDPGALDELAIELAAAPGRHLVVGHSNTTPELVSLLGGDPGPPIEEEREFDRLYVVVLAPDGTVTTLRLRYGAASGR